MIPPQYSETPSTIRLPWAARMRNAILELRDSDQIDDDIHQASLIVRQLSRQSDHEKTRLWQHTMPYKTLSLCLVENPGPISLWVISCWS